jgi:glyoxylase-like metal-dependent hydrolase (beta-lactamase superfamily II)
MGGTCASLQDVQPGVYAYLHSDGGWGHSNAGLVSAGGESLLIDTQYTLAMTRQLVVAVEAAGIPPVVTVVNTHANGDHCWGNQIFGQATIVASAATARGMPHDFPSALMATLMSDAHQTSAAGRYTRRHFGDFDFAGITVTTPTKTFSGRLDLTVGDRAVVLLDVGPAHSEGDVVAYVPDAGVLFAGDILFADHPVMWAGPLDNWIAACDTILDTGATRIVPGHGPITGREGVRRFCGYLEHVATAIEERFRRGMPYWEAAVDIPLVGYEHLAFRERLVVTAAVTYHHLGASLVPTAEVLERMSQAFFNAIEP